MTKETTNTVFQKSCLTKMLYWLHSGVTFRTEASNIEPYRSEAYDTRARHHPQS